MCCFYVIFIFFLLDRWEDRGGVPVQSDRKTVEHWIGEPRSWWARWWGLWRDSFLLRWFHSDSTLPWDGIPKQRTGGQESQKESMPVYGKYTTKWNNNNNTITYGSIFIFQELITFGHFISFLFSSLRHVKWAEQWAFGCRWQSNKQQLSANYVGQGRVMATWIIVHVQESN